MPKRSVKFDLDFSVKDILPKFKVKQLDDVVLNITTFNNKEAYNVGNFKAVIYIACDNDVFMQDNNISVSGNNITINLNRNMLKKYGKAIGEIELTDTVGTITCINFIFDIEGKIGEGASIPGGVEGFVEKYERLILEFKSQVDLCTKNANNLVNETIEKCNTNIDNKLNVVDGLISTKITNLEERFNALTASKQQDAEVVTARDGEVSLNARIERDLANTNRELEKIKKLEESTVSTVTSDKAFTTVAETTQGYFEDVKVVGKTLVNLAQKAVNTYTITSDSSSVIAKVNTKPLTTYTLAVTFSENKCTSSDNTGIFLCQTLFSAGVNLSGYDANGTVIRKITTGENPVSDWVIGARSSFKGTVSVSNFILLEGDHTQKPPSYFEGLKSVGQGADEIVISSCNENLFDEELLNSEVIYEDNRRCAKILNDSNSKNHPLYLKNDGKSVEGYVFKLDYKRTGDNTTIIELKYTDDTVKYIVDKSMTKNVWNTYEFVISKDIESVTLPFSDNQYTYLDLDSIVIAKNKDCKKKQDKKQILYLNPTTQTWEKPILREWDSIEKHSDGKYYYYKRSGEIVLNGSENWINYNQNTSRISFVSNVYNVNGAKDTTTRAELLCDKFKNITQDEVYNDKVGEGIAVTTTSKFVVLMDKSKLSTQDVAGFKAWLQANPTTVVYQLAKEEVYECTNLDLITYQNETNLIVNSGAIQPRITLKVLSNVSNVIKLLQEKVSVLENKFIEGLKQVLAGNMMSLAYLLYPEDFENNYEIQTLEEL